MVKKQNMMDVVDLTGHTVMRLNDEGQEPGQIMWTMLSMVAGAERNLIVQRLNAGTVAKYRRGPGGGDDLARPKSSAPRTFRCSGPSAGPWGRPDGPGRSGRPDVQSQSDRPGVSGQPGHRGRPRPAPGRQRYHYREPTC